MANIIGGYDTGLFDSSLFLLNRNDRTREGVAGHGEEMYVNVANGNLVLMHRDAFLPSQGDDYLLVRTYNSRGAWVERDGKGWSNNATILELSQITNNVITLVSADTSRARFYQDAATGDYVSVDGSGAYQRIVFDRNTRRYSLVQSNQTTLNFDINGTLVSSRDTNGNLVEYVYGQGKLQSLRDDQGHVVTYVYSNGDLVRVQDETGAVLVRYEYAQNQLIAVTDRAGHRTAYSYDTNGQLLSVTLPANAGDAQRVIRFTYVADPTDSNGQTRLLQTLTDAEGNRTDFSYQFNVDNYNRYNGGTTRVVTALGVNRRESNAAAAAEWRLANGYYATWDANRYATDAVYRAQADAVTARHTLTYGYDNKGAITRVIDQVGYETTYAYDASENLTAIVDANGYAITRSDDAYWRDLRRDFGYVDLAGQGKTVAQLSAAEVSALLARYTTRFEYDARGNLTRRTDNAGNVTTFSYAAFNKVATQTSAVGHALTTSDDLFYQDKRAELGYARSVAGLSAADRAALLALHTTTYSYDSRQNLVELRSPGGDLTRYQYDSFGNLTRRIVFLDAADLVTPSKQQVTQYFYDAYGQNVRTVDAEGHSSTSTFDHFGNLLTRTDARGGVTSYTYDADDRVLTKTDPEGHTTINTYDAVGNRTAMRDANGHTTLFVYDRNNMLIATIDPKDGDPSGNRTTSFGYDVVGNRTQATDAEGRITTYVYREDHRLVEVRAPAVQNAAGSGNASYSSRYEYDGVGHQIALTDFNGNRSQFVYNENGLLKRSTDAIGNVTEYRYDANLNQVQIVVGAQLAADRRRVLRFSFDEEDQRVAEADALGNTTRYARDAVGNVVATTDANNHGTEYSFDRNNRLITETFAGVTVPATGQVVRHTVSHQYDGNGNQIAVTDENGHTTRFSFDRDDRLVLVEDANGIKTAYGYDSRHNRTSVAIGVSAHLDASGHVVIDSALNAQVQTFAYDEFNQLVARTDGVGNALVTSDSALYQAMRQQMGYAANVAALSAADRQALLAAYTDRYAYDKVGNQLTATDHLGRVTRMAYDGLNREITRTDALGQAWRQRYDGNGNLVATVDALGREQAFAYDAVNRLVRRTDALGVATRNDYDNVGNLLESTRAFGTADARSTRFEYDLNNRVTRQLDPEGSVQSYEYDAVGNRLRLVDGRGNATAFVYDARDRLVRSIDPLGFETRVEYDGVGNRLALIDARGGITRMDYDFGNRLIGLTDAEGRVSRYEFDVRGNRITQRTAVGTADEQVTRYEYDAQNNLRAVVDAEGHRSGGDFDGVYNRIAATDGNGHTTVYAFDALNRQIRVTDALGQQTVYAYDAVGNRLSVTDALGRVTSFAYDAENRQTRMTAADGVVTTYSYDRVDNRIAMTRAAGLPEAQTTTYAYDLNDRLVTTTDALGHVTAYEYDEIGNVVAEVDPLGRRTTYAYDANNRVSRITDPLGHTTDYRYDGVGNRVQVIDALGRATTSYYNLDRELVLTVNAEGEATSVAYDANGNRVSETRHATRLAGTPDPAVRPLPAQSPGDETTRYRYDHLNRIVRVLDAEGHVAVTRYDAVGNVVSTTAYAERAPAGSADPFAPPASAKDRLTQFSYDSVDRLIERVDAEGFRTRWTYDAVGNRLTELRFLDRNNLVDPQLQQRSTTVYDAVNRVVSETSAIGVETRYAYDARGNRTAQTEAYGSAAARTTAYAYDAADRLVSQTDAAGTVTRLELDAAGQLLREIRAFGTPEARTTVYAYDAAGRRIEQTHADGTRERSIYDAVGNLLQRIDAAGSADERATTMAYDRVGRLLSQTVGAGRPEALVSSMVYDAFGNRTRQTVAEGTADARVMRYAYDHLDRVIAQTDGNGIVTLNDYDAFGNRVRTSITGSTLSAGGASVQRTEAMAFEYDGRNLLIGETNGIGTVVARQYDGAGNLRFQTDAAGSAAARTTEFRYDLANRLVAETVDPLGLALTTQYAYDERGNLVSETNADGLVSRTRFDILDRAVVTTDAEGYSVSFVYDRFGNQTAITTGQYLVAAGAPGYDAAKAARAMPATTLLAYDAMDRKVLQADAIGTVTHYAYDARGNRTLQTEAYGQLAAGQPLALGNVSAFAADVQRISRYTHDAVDRLVNETQPAGTVVHHAYNAAGEQTAKVVDFGVGAQFRNATTRFAYDAGGRLAFEVDAVGSVTQTVYDDFGNAVRVIRGLGLDAVGQPSAAPTADMRVTAYEYDAARRLTAQVVDPEGLALRTSHEYDRRNNQVAVVDGNGSRSEMAYDAADRAVWARDGEGYVTRIDYNGRGLMTAQLRYAANGAALQAGQLPAAGAQDRLAAFAYDAAGRLVESTDARGVVTRMAYDAIGNRLQLVENATGLFGSTPRVTTSTYTLNNQVATQTDPSGLVTRYAYDTVYNVVETRVENRWLDTLALDATGAPSPRIEEQRTTYRYDLNNRLTDVVIDPDGLDLHQAYRYDTLGNRIAEVAANGFAAAETDSAWAQSVRRGLGLVDGSGQAIAAAQLSAAQRQQVLDAHTSRTWFDAANRAIATVDANGHARTARYDAVGNVVRSTQHAQQLGTAQVAALDALTPPQLGAAVADRTIDRVFDKADRMTLERGPAARQFVNGAFVDDLRAETATVYDAAGNAVQQTDANGHTTYLYYDAKNRLLGRIDAEGYLTVNRLDAFGNVVEQRLSLERPDLSASQKEALDLDSYIAAGAVRVTAHQFDAGDHEIRSLYPESDLFIDGVHSQARVQVLRSFDAFGNVATETVMHREGQPAPAATHYQYDAAGRLVAKTDARADELLTSDAADIVALRRELGFVDASGAGKLASALTTAERAALAARHLCSYAYDAVGNVREQVEGERVTTFEYDLVHRSTRVHYPATRRVEVDADGAVTVTEGYRAVGRRSFDANGNVLSETRVDGERIDYRYDAGNRQVAALNDGVYSAYSYNFAGEPVELRRYVAAATGIDAPPPADGTRDQVIQMAYDRLGRKVVERQLGLLADASDDRVVHFDYDANGNQVRTTDARGNVSTVVYDGLNRIVATVNSEGGVTQTGYDAQGNVVARQTGGFTAPSLRGGVRIDRVSDSGATLEWSTDHATDALLYVRPAGSGAAWTVFGTEGQLRLDHSVQLTGLAASTAYEYYFVSRDAFGYTLESAVRSFSTVAGISAVALDQVRQVGAGFEARLGFALPPGASQVRVLVGSGSADALTLTDTVAFTPVQQPDGSYSVTLAYDNADALFQVEWTDAEGLHRSGAAAIQQRVDTRRLDVTLQSTPQGSAYGVTVSWNLADALAAGEIDSDTPAGQPTAYSVYVGIAGANGQDPTYVQATLQGGVFVAQFDGVTEGGRTFFFEYTRPDGSTVTSPAVAVGSLVGLDQRYQNLEFDFPDVQLGGTQLRLRTRPVGSTTWTDLPASAINGLSANVLGLATGAYEYEATLVRGSEVLRRASGAFSMREPAAVSGLVDNANPGTVAHTIADDTLTLPGVLPVAADETLTVTLADADGNAVPASFSNGSLDLAVLTPGSYTLHVLKTRTVTTTSGEPPVTTTTTVTVNDIAATVVVGPLTLTDVQADALEGSRSLTAYALDATRTEAAQVTASGTSSADHSWSVYDGNGWRLYSNENGGVWTRYFYDGQGNVTKEVRFQRRDAQGNFVDAIADSADRPSLATLEADYEAAVAAGPDRVRVTTRAYDAAKQQLRETELSAAFGAVTSRWAHDRFGNKILEVSAEGIAGIENATRMSYDAGNRVLSVQTGPFAHADEAGNTVTTSALDSFTYDARGNQSTHTDARGFTERFHYDAFNRLASQWDGQRQLGGVLSASTLRTDHVYDAFDRMVERRANDLTGRASQAVQVTRYDWTQFDQLAGYTDALGHRVSRSYDANGNQLSETDALGHAESFGYDSLNRAVRRTDRLGSVWTTAYDAYGQRLSETDANGRVTTFSYGAFGQLLGSHTVFSAGYASLGGAASSTDTQHFDWLGRLVDQTDSFGKHLRFSYNDADQQIRISDLALNKAVDYRYDALGRRTEETLTRNGLVQRHQTNRYNNQGWLEGVTADAGFDAGGGATINQQLAVSYAFDAEGNRVRVSDANNAGSYSFDASGRMTSGRDDKRNEVVSQIVYDGYGNRLSETRPGAATTSYSYDAGNRVTSSSAGEQWSYDANGNTTFYRGREGDTTSTQYNAENRSTRTISTADGKTSTSVNRYDAVGNVISARVTGENYSFTEVTRRDVRYLETAKDITESYAKGAKRLEGHTRFTYDVNGNLVFLDRGRKQGADQSSVAVFDYDLEGHIIGRADKATALTSSEFFQGYALDPDVLDSDDGFAFLFRRTVTQQVQQQLFGGASGSTTHLQSHLYANNHPISEASGDQILNLKKLSLVGGEEVRGPGTVLEPGEVIGYRLSLEAGDIVAAADGSVDRAATARRIAQRAYSGYSQLSTAAQNKVVGYVRQQLDAQLPSDAQLTAGAEIEVFGYILLVDATATASQQITDYSLRQLGADGTPGGSVQSHVVRAGDTLQSIAAIYFGSPSYWYLIADANGLTGIEPLQEGTTLSIPNAVANSVNTADTYKVYNESEIIGTTSPEIRTIKKKKKWYQKLIQIIIVVILVVAAVIVAIYAPQVFGAVSSAIGGALGTATGVVAAAGFGAAVYAGASIVTQGLAVAAGLQDSFSWKQVGKAAVSGAFAGFAAGLAAGYANTGSAFYNAAVRVSGEVGRQLIVDGKISNVAGIVGAAAQGGVFKGLGEAGSNLRAVSDFITNNPRTFSAGLSVLENAVRGKGNDAMSWVGLATAAIFDRGILQDADGYQLRDNLTAASGKINWQFVAVHAVGATVVGSLVGEDAALGYIGNAIGTGISSDMYREMGRVTPRTLQLKTIETLIASQPEKADELRRLRDKVLGGESGLTFELRDPGSEDLMVRGQAANAVYSNGTIRLSRELYEGATNSQGNARLLAAVSEEVGEWVAAEAGIQFRNNDGQQLDAGAIIGLQTMARLASEAGAAGGPLMFSLNVEGMGNQDFSTDVTSLAAATIEQFTPERLLANASDPSGAAQLKWRFDPAELKRRAAAVFGRGADEAITTGGFAIGIAQKGVDAVRGLGSLAGDLLGANAYFYLKLAGADSAAARFESNFNNIGALVDATGKFFESRSIGQAAYDIFAKPIADGYVKTGEAYERALQVRAKNPSGYSLERAGAFFDYGVELGKFGVDVALAVASVVGVGLGAKALFNVGTTAGKALATSFAGMGGTGSIASAIEGLAGRFTASMESLVARARGTLAGNTTANPLRAGQVHEAEQLAKLGVEKNSSVFRPTAEQVETATFKAIVGEPKYTRGGQLKGTIFDGTQGGYLEIKGGTSELNSTYQLRLQTYKATIDNQPFTIQTTRPVNPEFQRWLEFWGVNVTKP